MYELMQHILPRVSCIKVCFQSEIWNTEHTPNGKEKEERKKRKEKKKKTDVPYDIDYTLLEP